MLVQLVVCAVLVLAMLLLACSGPAPFRGFARRRPDAALWLPVANCSDRDEIDCYQAAADLLGVKIMVAYPVPCASGADYVALCGMRGVYIATESADRKDELMVAYCDAKHELLYPGSRRRAQVARGGR